MGCGTISCSKSKQYKDQSSKDIDQNLQFTANLKDLIVKFPNFQLLAKFLSKPIIKQYFTTLFKSKGDIEDNKLSNFSNLFDEIKECFDELFQKFKITYYIPKKSEIIECLGSYKLEISPSSQIDLDLFMPIFFLELCFYPKSFMKKSKIKTFVFVHSLIFITPEFAQPRAGCPEFNKTFSLYYTTDLRDFSYIQRVMHHELFHYIDWTVNRTYDCKNWRELNSRQFKYGKGGAYERQHKSLSEDIKGFLNFYSTTAIEEDKAEIYQYLFTGQKEVKNIDEIIQNKILFMRKFLQKYDKKFMLNDKDDYFSSISKLREEIQKMCI
jgi:hypothetical protein